VGLNVAWALMWQLLYTSVSKGAYLVLYLATVALVYV